MSVRWDQLTPKARCYLLFKKIDINTRALAKIASALVYLTDGFHPAGLEPDAATMRSPQDSAPDLLVRLRTIVRERQNLKLALESELAAMWREADAVKASQVGKKDGAPPLDGYEAMQARKEGD